MKKSLLELYALVVCFVTVICFSVSLGTGLYDMLQIKNPEFTVDSSSFERHQNNDMFI